MELATSKTSESSMSESGHLQSEWEKHARVFQLAQNGIQAIRPGGMGDVTESNVLWRYRKALPSVASPIVYKDVVYMVKDGGILTSLDRKTGKLLKQGRVAGVGNYYASPVAGNDKLFVASERGVLSVVKAGAEWEVLDSHDFGERIMATPVIRDGQIFVRTDVGLHCFGYDKR